MNHSARGSTLSAAERDRIAEISARAVHDAAAIAELIGSLSAASWSERRELIAALAALGDVAVAPLCDNLRQERGDETQIAAVVDALCASLGDATSPVLALCAHPNAAVAADAAHILGRRHASIALPALAQLTRHADDNVAVAAIEALGRIGGRAAVDALVETVESRHFFRTFPAIDVLGRSGDPRAVPPLVALLEQPQYSIEAARALGRSGDASAVAPLARMMLSPSDAHVRIGARAIADLFERQREQLGTSEPGEDRLRRAGSYSLVRRAGQALQGADDDEQLALCEILGTLRNPAAIPALERLLAASGTTAGAAAEALRKVGSDADMQLAEALASGDSTRRRALLPLVTRQAAVPAVVNCLQDEDSAVRALACAALGRIGDATAVAALFPLLGEPDARIAQAALAALHSLGSRQTEQLALQAARSPQAKVRHAAMRLMSYFGYASAYDAFAAAMTDADQAVRDAAISGVGLIEHPGVLELLLAAAADPSPRTRAAAMRGLGQSPRSERGIECLCAALTDADSWVRYYACQALGRLGAEAAAPLLSQRLEDDAGQVRVAAVEALSHLKHAQARSALRRAANAQELDIRRAALIGLGISGDGESLPLLLQAAAGDDSATRLIALSALTRFDDPQVGPALRAATVDADAGVRAAAIASLATLSGAEATAALIELLDSEEFGARALAALASPVEGRLAGVLFALESADDELAARLTSVLARLERGQPGSAVLLRALQSSNPAARKAAAGALGAVGNSEARAALQQRAREDSSDEVRRVCALLLSR